MAKTVTGTEWFLSGGADTAIDRYKCIKCGGLMVEDKAMSAVFELTTKNFGEFLDLSSFEVSLWACPDCGHREGSYSRGPQ